MNILLSTTHFHNPGDEIIAEGVKNLLRNRFGSNLTYFSYNRNPDLQEDPQRRLRQPLVGNYMTSPELIDHMDMVVLAGSPEWFGGPMETLYKAIRERKRNIPMLALGVGLGHAHGALNELDMEILGRPETKIITRSYETTEWLTRYGIESSALTCPALFAFEANLFSASDKTLQIVQAPGHDWHEVPARVLEQLDRSVDMLCLHVKEFQHYSKLGLKPIYANNLYSFADIVSQYDKVVSTRLHGAIGALSLGVPAVVVSDGDFRIETAAKMFGEHLPVAKSVREALNMNLPKQVDQGFVEMAREAWLGKLEEFK